MLIDRLKVKEIVNATADAREALSKILALPTVDAVPVVRCKDCKYCSVDRHSDGNVPDYACIEMDCGVEADGFCSWGERREE